MKLRFALAVAATCCSLAAPAQTPAVSEPDGAASPAPAQGRRPDERRPEQAVAITLFGRPVELGLSYEVSHDRRLNFDLDATLQSGRDVLDHELKLDARWRIGRATTGFVQGVALADQRTARRDGSVRRQHSFERGQTWLLVEGLAGLPLSMQIGRIALLDRRSWWWDEDLDAVRLSMASGAWRLDTGLAHELGRVSSALPGIEPVAKGVTRWFGDASVRWAPQHALAVFWLTANDSSGAPAAGSLFDAETEDASDARLRWFGLRATGELRNGAGHRFSYRADAALVDGRETRTPFTDTPGGRLSAGNSTERDVRGHAWDLGLQWRLPGGARPTFSLGLASGSGGTDSDTRDRNFRQTGLQENKGRVAGVKRVRYYGELLDPELSNLRIATLGLGLRALPNSSVELLLHRYRQQSASTRLAGSRLAQDPLGLNRDIGQEIDLLVALREWRHVELTMRLSTFRPGAAFAIERRDPAHSIEIGAGFTF